jgi:glycosyltransferase involved in cell wall biosynthesis
MNSKAKVSVIIPAYNSAACIENALRSVAEQTCLSQPVPHSSQSDVGSTQRAQIEIIVVDDASTDSTADAVRAMCKVQSEKSEQGRTFHLAPYNFRGIPLRLICLDRNGGPAAARNSGIAEAAGEWIAFLDSDDEWLPGKLDKQLELAASRKDICLWCTGVESIASDDEVEELSLENFITNNPIATSTVMVRREALRNVGGFDEIYHGAEDYDLWLRLIAFGKCRAARINMQLITYRSHSGSLSMDERKFLPDALAVLEKTFGAGGALAQFQEQKPLALANQYWNASWMAFNRGSRSDAIRLWRKGYCLGRRALHRPWCRLLLRYVFGEARKS